MVAVTQNKIFQILLPAFLKSNFFPFKVMVFIMPLVIHLIHNKKAHLIADIHKNRRLGVMASAYGIYTHALKYLKPSFYGRFTHCSAQAPDIMMQVDTFKHHLFTIEQTSLLSGKFYCPDTKYCLIFVYNPVFLYHGCYCLIKTRGRNRP